MKKLFSLLILLVFALTGFAKTLWTGSCSFANWNPVEGDERPVLTTADFADATVGDKLVLSVTSYGNENNREVQIYTWDGFGSGLSVTSYGGVPEGASTVTFTLDESLLSVLRETDVCIIGTGYTVTLIELINPDEIPFDGIIWEGESNCPDWTADPAVRLLGSEFSMAKIGDELVFTVEILVPGEWAALQVDTSDWKVGPFGETVLEEGQTEVIFVLDETLYTSLVNDGINITGANFKLTKIQLIAGGGDVPPVDENVIWVGTLTTGNWADYLTIGADKLEKVQAGYRLLFTVTESGANGQICIKQNLDGWAEMPSDAGEWGNYIHVEQGAGIYSFEINAAAAESMKEYGMVVAGNDYTITKIVLNSGTSSVIDSLENGISTSGPVYNLQGIRVADSLENVAAPGLYISGGKKIVVK